jgi:hypothetical protein
LEDAIRDNIDRRLPLQFQIGSQPSAADPSPHYHHVVIDGYSIEHNTEKESANANANGGAAPSESAEFWVHLNVGHSGYDNDWYRFDQPICLRHYQNGTLPPAGDCAFLYDDIGYKILWTLALS